MIGAVRRAHVDGGAPQLTLGLLVAPELRQDRAELPAIGRRVRVRRSTGGGVQLEREARLALGGLQIAAAVREPAEVVMQHAEHVVADTAGAEDLTARACSASPRRRSDP